MKDRVVIVPTDDLDDWIIKYKKSGCIVIVEDGDENRTKLKLIFNEEKGKDNDNKTC